MNKSKLQKHVYRYALVVVAVVLATALTGWSPFASALSSQAQLLAPAAGGWSITDVARAGQNGFTQISGARIGDNGAVVIFGARGTESGIYQVQAGNVITVATIGTVLPGGLGTISQFAGNFAVDNQGRVLFVARVTGADPPGRALRVYRWENGVISRMKPDDAAVVEHHLDVVTSAGEWVVSQFIGSGGIGTRNFYLTDGLTPTLRLSAAENTVCDSDSIRTRRAVPGDNQVMLYYSYQKISAPPGSCNFRDVTVNWKLDISTAGAITQTKASGTYFSRGQGLDGEDIHDSGQTSLLVNEQGSIVFGKQVRTPPAAAHYQLVKVDGSGQQVLFDTDTSGFTGQFSAVTFDNAGRVALTAELDDGRFGLFAGPSTAEAVILTGDTLFGQTVTGISEVGGSTPPATFGDNRSFVFRYQLADGTIGIALATKGVALWTNPAGGSWNTAANWTPAEVPGATAETLFNLDADYTVNVGTHDVGRVRIEDGFVTFDNANLALLGPLTVGNDATFDLTSGTLETGELIIGSLPPIDILNPPTAHGQISNQGTILTGTTVIAIGHTSPGSLFLENAEIHGGTLLIGENFPGRAALSGSQAVWRTAGATAVGYNYTGTLSIESGALMRSAGEVVIGQGNSLQDYTSVVYVKNFNAPLNAMGMNWMLLDTFSLGNFLRGELYISDGGRVAQFGDDSILQAGLRAHPGPGFDAFISVDGSNDTANVGSYLKAFNNVLLGMADQASVGVNISHGGQWVVDYADLFLGFIPGSEAVMTVAGRNSHNKPALLQVTRPLNNFSTGVCSIGEGGTGLLLIHSGGQVECGSVIRIGGQPGSSGFVQVNGANGGSTLTTEGALCIAGDMVGLCGAAESGSQGTLELKNSASVSAGVGTIVGPGGKIIGNGDIAVGTLGLVVQPGGSIDPGVTILGAQRLTAPSSQTIQPGALNIGGNVAFSPTAVITLDVIGQTPSLYDRLIVTGTANLGGQLVLNFGNGFAPKQGDSFSFMQAGVFAGSFQTTTIAGLEPGFTYTLSATGGAFNLAALNDGVPTTSALSKVYLPIVIK